MLKSEAAAEEKGNKIFSPDVDYVGWLGMQATIDENPIAGHVGSEVASRGCSTGFGIARTGYLKHRAGLGVASAKLEEVGSVLFGENHEVRLNPSGDEPGGWPGNIACANRLTKSLRRGEVDLCVHLLTLESVRDIPPLVTTYRRD